MGKGVTLLVKNKKSQQSCITLKNGKMTLYTDVSMTK